MNQDGGKKEPAGTVTVSATIQLHDAALCRIEGKKKQDRSDGVWAGWLAIGAIATLGLFASGVWQICELRRSIELANRPWLLIASVTPEEALGPARKLVLEVKLRNTGPSPAMIESTEIAIRGETGPAKVPTDFIDNGIGTPVIPPTVTDKMFTLELSGTIDQPMWDAVKAGTHTMRFYIRIAYQDQFGKGRGVVACVQPIGERRMMSCDGGSMVW